MTLNRNTRLGVLSVGLIMVAGLTGCAADTEAQTAADGKAYPADCSKIDLSVAPGSPAKLSFAHGTAAEEPIYLMEANVGTTPNRGKWYEPTYSTVSKSSDRMTSIVSGQLDGASMSIPPLVSAKAKDLDFSLVASVSKEAEGHFLTTFVALDNSGIKSAEDLKGKTIAIADYGTSHDYWAQKAVASAGLDPQKDVKYAVIPLPSMEDALRNGTVDVAGPVEPFYSIAETSGGLVDVFNSLTGSGTDRELQDAIFGNAYIKANPGAVSPGSPTTRRRWPPTTPTLRVRSRNFWTPSSSGRPPRSTSVRPIGLDPMTAPSTLLPSTA
ncbi:ABC transporter substrate-binding protein [Nocardioides sp. B-3]|uniref:ABC transporter substrate-binding protein n=1 Tax=Nocardioides sp. B-3 TaxID=2895565 RepID=UPI0021522CE1|nr:ABC transporter substrate-binding protein [Nocardioides sp. B-3]UUZ60288.1 ABC transporter substrate-binding protein [Nocardioides sp. B-3]